MEDYSNWNMLHADDFYERSILNPFYREIMNTPLADVRQDLLSGRERINHYQPGLSVDLSLEGNAQEEALTKVLAVIGHAAVTLRALYDAVLTEMSPKMQMKRREIYHDVLTAIRISRCQEFFSGLVQEMQALIQQEAEQQPPPHDPVIHMARFVSWKYIMDFTKNDS